MSPLRLCPRMVLWRTKPSKWRALRIIFVLFLCGAHTGVLVVPVLGTVHRVRTVEKMSAMVDVKRGDELGEPFRRLIAKVLVRGFAEDFSSFSADSEKFADAFALMLVLRGVRAPARPLRRARRLP